VGVALVLVVIIVSLIAAVVPGLLSASPKFDEGTRKVAALVTFLASYLALAIGKIPGLSIDCAGVALVGAGLMVASGVLSLEDAYRAIDLDTITLLLSMMIVVASLRLSGFCDRDDLGRRVREDPDDPAVRGHRRPMTVRSTSRTRRMPHGVLSIGTRSPGAVVPGCAPVNKPSDRALPGPSRRRTSHT